MLLEIKRSFPPGVGFSIQMNAPVILNKKGKIDMIEPIKGEFNYSVSVERGTLLVSEYYLRDVLVDLGFNIAHSGGTDWDRVIPLARQLGFTPLGYIEELDMEVYVSPLALVGKRLRPYFSGQSSEQWWEKELPAGESVFTQSSQSIEELLFEQTVCNDTGYKGE